MRLSKTTGKFLFSANSSSGNITIFKPNTSTGVLGAAIATKESSGISSLTMDSTGQYLYSIGNSFAYTSIVFSIDQHTGLLSEVQRSGNSGRLVLTR